MWVTAGVAVVVAAAVVILVAFLEDETRVAPRRSGTITAEELRSAPLPVAWRGYDRGHVDALLARAAQTLDEVRRYGVDVVAPDGEERGDDTPVPPSFLAEPLAGQPSAPGEEATTSGEELEDGSGDGTRGLDG